MQYKKPGEVYNAHKKMAMKKKYKSISSLNNRGQMTYGKNSPNLSTQGVANSGFGGVSTIKRAKKRHKGHRPKGAHGRAAVKALGRTKTTGNFAKIEKTKGRAAAIGAYQNALKAHKAGK